MQFEGEVPVPRARDQEEEAPQGAQEEFNRYWVLNMIYAYVHICTCLSVCVCVCVCVCHTHTHTHTHTRTHMHTKSEHHRDCAGWHDS
jgi:hypothetical protein